MKLWAVGIAPGTDWPGDVENERLRLQGVGYGYRVMIVRAETAQRAIELYMGAFSEEDKWRADDPPAIVELVPEGEELIFATLDGVD